MWNFLSNFCLQFRPLKCDFHFLDDKNFVLSFWQLCGGLFLAMGLWLHLSNQGYATLYPNHMGLSAESLFILIGAMSIVISFFGCCGSFFESRCCLIIVSHTGHVVKVNLMTKTLLSTSRWSSFCSWASLSSGLWCLSSAREFHELSPWTSKTASLSTTTQPTEAEWCRHRCQQSGIAFNSSCSAVVSTHTRIGTTSKTGRRTNGCQSHAAVLVNLSRQSSTKAQVMKSKAIAERKYTVRLRICSWWIRSLSRIDRKKNSNQVGGQKVLNQVRIKPTAKNTSS